MKIIQKSGKLEKIESEVIAIPVFEDTGSKDTLLRIIDKATNGSVRFLEKKEILKGKKGEFHLLKTTDKFSSPWIALIGAGQEKDFAQADCFFMSATAVFQLQKKKFTEITILERGDLKSMNFIYNATLGALYGTYQPGFLKTKDKPKTIENLCIFTNRKIEKNEFDKTVSLAAEVGNCVLFTRTLVDTPANTLTPGVFIEKARKVAKESSLEIDILDDSRMRQLAMGALLAVAKGSDEDPYMVVMKYKARGYKGKPMAFIGKGITFDSGGLSLKPQQYMLGMKGDMAGAAAVLGAMKIISILKPKIDVIGIIPLAENMPGGHSIRPGDVVNCMDGQSIEIENTDAEGRLILADAIAFAVKEGAGKIVDIATLTGACEIALGHLYGGAFSNNEAFLATAMRASQITGEHIWRLPIDEEYFDEMKSPIADMKNVGTRAGGAITAAKFLQQFVGDVPWLHIDIAGVSDFAKEKPYSSKTASGFGARLLAQIADEESR